MRAVETADVPTLLEEEVRTGYRGRPEDVVTEARSPRASMHGPVTVTKPCFVSRPGTGEDAHDATSAM